MTSLHVCYHFNNDNNVSYKHYNHNNNSINSKYELFVVHFLNWFSTDYLFPFYHVSCYVTDFTIIYYLSSNQLRQQPSTTNISYRAYNTCLTNNVNWIYFCIQ